MNTIDAIVTRVLDVRPYQGGRIRNGKLSTDRLDVAAQLAGWPTPTTSNDRSPCPQEAMRTYRDNGTKIQKRLQDVAAL